MLELKRKITYTGRSVINGVAAAGFQAIIDFENPSNMSTNNWVIDKALYKENRIICRADQASFEDQVYALQDEMILAVKSGKEE